MEKRCKKAPNPASFEALNQKKIVQSRSRVLHLPPAHTTTYEVDETPQSPSGLSPGHTLPSHHVRNKLGRVLSEGEQATEFAVCSCSPFCSRGPNKSWPEKKSEIFFNAKVLCHFLFNLATFTYIHIMEHCIPLYSLLREFPTGLSLL